MLPGAQKYREQLDQVNDKDLDRAEAIVRSMTPEERRNPKIINGSLRARIAKGSGVAIGEVSQLVTNFFEGQKQMKAMFSGGIPGMPAMPGVAGAARRASKSARKKTKKKAPRSGDPRRAAELAGGGQQGQDPKAANGPGQLPAGLPNLGGGLGDLPEGLSENLAEQLSKMPSGLNFPPQGPQGNIPAAFRGGGKRKKK